MTPLHAGALAKARPCRGSRESTNPDSAVNLGNADTARAEASVLQSVEVRSKEAGASAASPPAPSTHGAALGQLPSRSGQSTLDRCWGVPHPEQLPDNTANAPRHPEDHAHRIHGSVEPGPTSAFDWERKARVPVLCIFSKWARDPSTCWKQNPGIYVRFAWRLMQRAWPHRKPFWLY